MLHISNDVNNLYPGVMMGILAMRNVKASAPPDPAFVQKTVEAIRGKYGHLDRNGLKVQYPISIYAAYYRTFGYSYHVLAQLESILSGKRSLGGATGLLTAMFQTELETMLLTAGHDMDRLTTPLRLMLSTGQETFRSISGKDVHTVENDLMVVSGETVISSILRGPDFGSRITPDTKNVLFTVYAPPGIEIGTVKQALQKLEEMINRISSACETIDLSVYPCS